MQPVKKATTMTKCFRNMSLLAGRAYLSSHFRKPPSFPYPFSGRRRQSVAVTFLCTDRVLIKGTIKLTSTNKITIMLRLNPLLVLEQSSPTKIHNSLTLGSGGPRGKGLGPPFPPPPPPPPLSEVIKIGKDAIKGHLVNLFNRISDTGKYPTLWSFGLIVPIHKKDDRSKVENYRGITLLSALGKLFTSILNNRLYVLHGTYVLHGSKRNLES